MKKEEEKKKIQKPGVRSQNDEELNLTSSTYKFLSREEI
jgi:hypothetical protein